MPRSIPASMLRLARAKAPAQHHFSGRDAENEAALELGRQWSDCVVPTQHVGPTQFIVKEARLDDKQRGGEAAVGNRLAHELGRRWISTGLTPGEFRGVRKQPLLAR